MKMGSIGTQLSRHYISWQYFEIHFALNIRHPDFFQNFISWCANIKSDRVRCHRKLCRYLKTKEGSYRNEACQYIHDSTTNNNKTEQPNKKEDKCDNSFECNNGDFKCNRSVTLKKHINTKHSRQSTQRSQIVLTLCFKGPLQRGSQNLSREEAVQ